MIFCTLKRKKYPTYDLKHNSDLEKQVFPFITVKN